MKRNHIIIALVACTVFGFALGLTFESLVGKTYAKTEATVTNFALSEETAYESIATGASRSADYEIVYVYGKKYIIFSSGGDIEVLPYE